MSIKTDNPSAIPLITTIPLMRKNSTCPMCHKKVYNFKTADLVLYYRKYTHSITARLSLHYCKTCNLFLLHGQTDHDLRKKHIGYHPETIRITDEDRNHLYDIELKMVNLIPQVNGRPPIQRDGNGNTMILGFKLLPLNGRKLKPGKIISYPSSEEICPVCIKESSIRHGFHEWKKYLPYSPEKVLLVPGRYCSRCNNFFVSKDDVSRLEQLINHYNISGYPIEKMDVPPIEEFPIEEPPNIEEELYIEETYNPELTLTMKDVDNGNIITITITPDKTAETESPRRIIHYCKKEVRELLARIVHDKKDIVFWEGRQYKVVSVDKNEEVLSPKQIYINQYGGYSIGPYEASQIVHVLLYSEKTNCYEITRATCEDGQYFIALTLYKDFVSKYGKPSNSVKIQGEHDSAYRWYDDFNKESRLHKLGYSVSKSSNLSNLGRHRLLSDIIELDLMKPYEIISHLNWLKDCRSYQTEACSKWEMDIRFIQNKYIANPDRFVIGEMKQD